MFIAVVDEMGKLVAFARMGETGIGFGEKISMAKAKTAVAYKRSTKDTMDRYASLSGQLFYYSDGRFVSGRILGRSRRGSYHRRWTTRGRTWRFRFHSRKRSQVRH